MDNPSFFHAFQMDIEEQITSVFWCDANMILYYGYFGDVMSFDITYCTNHANKPIAFVFLVLTALGIQSFLVQLYCTMRQFSHLNVYWIHSYKHIATKN